MNNQSQDALISESASEIKRRRGRPTVFQRDHMEGMEGLCTADKHRTRRSHVADYYRGSVFGILEDHSDIPYLEGIFRIDGNACIVMRLSPPPRTALPTSFTKLPVQF